LFLFFWVGVNHQFKNWNVVAWLQKPYPKGWHRLEYPEAVALEQASQLGSPEKFPQEQPFPQRAELGAYLARSPSGEA
jgi:hypothetical protein